MRSRREQLQAYRFVQRRAVAAVLSGEPESTELPMRRLGLATFVSVMLASIIVAGVGVYAVLNPGGNDSWKDENALTIEKETGARYVYRDGRLRPVVNYSSARLILGSADPRVVSVSRASLAGESRGLPVGILGAPDEIPDADKLMSLPWTVCATDDAIRGSSTVLSVGTPVGGGQALGKAGLLVRGTDERHYLILGNRRMLVPDYDPVAFAFRWPQITPPTVGAAFLNALPAGPDLRTLPIPGYGQRYPQPVGGQTAYVGSLFETPDGKDHYLLVQGGVVPISEIVYRLHQAQAKPKVRKVELSDIAVLPVRHWKPVPAGFPEEIPQVDNPEGDTLTFCVAYEGKDKEVSVRFHTETPKVLREAEADAANSASRRLTASHVAVADRVLVPGGSGALVSIPNSGVVYLITDQGMKYQLMGDAARKALGYQDVEPIPVSADFLSTMPAGPALDQAAAVREVDLSPADPDPASSPSTD